MDFLFHETLLALNVDDVFEFGMTSVSKSKDDEGFYEATVIFIRNGSVVSRFTIRSIGEFDVLRGCVSYIGSTLRGISKNQNINFDLSGLSFDQYIPLSKAQRLIWDE
jgi:hypothetical protein